MEMKVKEKHHKKHRKHLHRPLDAYELYEREHMPHDLGLVKLQVHDTGREVQPTDVRVSRPDYYETGTAKQPPEGHNGAGDFEESVDAGAEDFIRLKHNKFDLTK